MTEIYYYSPSAHYLRSPYSTKAPRTDAEVQAAADKRSVFLAWLTPYAVFGGLLFAHLLLS